MPPYYDEIGPGGYAYGWRWGSDGRVLEEIRAAATALGVTTDRVIYRVLETLDRKGTPVDLDGTHLHRLFRYRITRRGDEVLSVELAR